jgi:hypothetical protein
MLSRLGIYGGGSAVVVDLSGAEEFGGGTGRNGDWLRLRCLSPFLPVPLSSTAGEPQEPNKFELNSIRNDPLKLEILRLRLSDLGWWMRVMCQYIAVRANREDHELGKLKLFMCPQGSLPGFSTSESSQ